jgi:hypothetical protein
MATTDSLISPVRHSSARATMKRRRLLARSASTKTTTAKRRSSWARTRVESMLPRLTARTLVLARQGATCAAQR